jgi:ribosomal-protein-alanine N-acetyltransferase
LRYIGRDPAKNIQEAVDHIQLVDGMIETNEAILWGITLRSVPSTIIGTIGYWRVIKEHHRSEIGYVLHPDHWNKGIMKEALQAVIGYAFNHMNLHSIEARIDPANLASAQLLRSCGFVEEGYFKEDYLLRGRFVDTQVFSLVTLNETSI